MRQLNKSIPWRSVKHGFALTVVWNQHLQWNISYENRVTYDHWQNLIYYYAQPINNKPLSCVNRALPQKFLKVFVYGNIITTLDNIFSLTFIICDGVSSCYVVHLGDLMELKLIIPLPCWIIGRRNDISIHLIPNW